MFFLRLNIVLLALICCAGQSLAQVEAQLNTASAGTTAPIVLTLQDAIAHAKQNLPQFLAAKNDAGLAHQDKVQARAALLPSITYENQFLYTQGNGTPSGVFIANNAVHEYVSQGNAHESINLAGGQLYDLKRAQASEAAAKAKLEIASRGLVVTTTQSYYGVAVAQRKYATAQKAFTESQRLFKITQDL